jgi:hypothetical protein
MIWCGDRVAPEKADILTVLRHTSYSGQQQQEVVMHEEWRQIPDTHYSASSLGRIRNDRTGRVLRQSLKKRYLQVCIWPHSHLVHSLVLLAFGHTRPPGHTTHHKDHNKHNNAISNLCYVTQSENVTEAIRAGRCQTGSEHYLHREPWRVRGSNNATSKLTEKDVRHMRLTYVRRHNGMALAKKYGLNLAHFSDIMNGHVWAHVAPKKAIAYMENIT